MNKKAGHVALANELDWAQAAELHYQRFREALHAKPIDEEQAVESLRTALLCDQLAELQTVQQVTA